ncbi:MAG: hypothetical protein GX323_06020 [Clostridiales bacterium]|nr:hypothetical protein [Clostridiales bacterium]
MEIKTNIGTFGSFRDIETCMRLEGLKNIEVISIKALMETWERLAGQYTYNEIKQIIDTKGVLE